MSGILDLEGEGRHPDSLRLRDIAAAATPYLGGVDFETREDEWSGARPLTPSGLPFIGAVDSDGRLLVAAGHNMLGVTLAPATARVVTELICDGRASIDLSAFQPPRSTTFGLLR